MKKAALIVALALAPLVFAPLAAHAQEPAGSAPATAAYAAPVEAIPVSGAKARLMEMGQAAAGYSILYRGGQGASMRIGTQTRSSYRNIFRYTDAAEVELMTGVCRIRVEGQSAFGVQWNQQTSQLYSCEIKDKPADRYALDVMVPAFKQASFSLGGLSVEATPDVPDATMQAILRAKMVFDGVVYEATPTAFADRTSPWEKRVVRGYAITRDGAAVGRIDFGRNSNDRGSITAPVAETDGRQAVLFFAHQLAIMPDLYSAAVRSEVFR